MKKTITRLAPSPSGYLHLGNAWSFVMCWLICRSMKGELILRIDDLDPERSREHFTKAIIEDLHWLGLDWDRGPDQVDGGLYIQSKRGQFYTAALETLRNRGELYPCFCSRKELRMLANAPHKTVGEKRNICPCANLPINLVKEKLANKHKYALKIRSGSDFITFNDYIYGGREYSPADYGGDFALRRSDGVFSYQLASTVDDALMGVNLVIRGNDLLESSPRQILILKRLGYEIPQYAHIPLILDQKGERLAKRHGDLSLRALRKRGIKPEKVLGLIAYWANIQNSPDPSSLKEMLKNFSISKISTANIKIPDFLFV